MAKITRVPVTSDSEESFDIHDIASAVNKSLQKSTENTFMVGNEENEAMDVPFRVRTGIPCLDYAIGGSHHPGIPVSRITEIYGSEGCGKSTLCVWITKQAIDQLKTFAVYQDAEHVLTDEIIQGTGINMSKVILQHPDILEEVFDSQEAVINQLGKMEKKPKAVVMVLDSVASCSTRSEVDGDYGESTMGIHARIMSQALRKIKAPIFKNNVLSLFVNQTRDKMNVSWGSKTETFGGKALKFYASVRLELTKIKTLKKDGKDPHGCTIQFTVIKNKVAPPLMKDTFDILFIQDKNGSYPKIDTIGAVLDWCKKYKIIGGTTGRFEIDGKSMYRDAAREYLEENPDVLEDLIEQAYSVDTSSDSRISSNDDYDDEIDED